MPEIYPRKNVLDKHRDRAVFGICYRSGYHYDADGNADFSVYDGFDPETGLWNKTTNQAEYDAADAFYVDALSGFDDNPIADIYKASLQRYKEALVTGGSIDD